jgi:Glycosyltransferase family 10 (fucosyltransferase) C-term
MITILSFIPQDYIKSDKNNDHSKTISLFSSIKTSILSQTFTNWELFLVTNVKNVNFEDENSTKEMVDLRIKIVYTPDSYLNFNSLYDIDDKLYNSKCKYISIFDLEHDVWNINKLQFQHDAMDIHNYDVVGCECSPSNECVDSNYTRIIKIPQLSLFHSCPFLCSTILIKKNMFKHFNSDVESFERNICNNDTNFTIVNTSFNTIMAQFHSLLLFMTLREYKICYIGHSKQTNNKNGSNNEINNHNSNYKYRIINHSLVETSNDNKLSNLSDNKTCNHIFFINSQEYLREKYMRIKIYSDFCNSERCKQRYETLCKVHTMNNYGPDKYLNITTGNTYTHAILLNCPIVPDISVPPECVLGLAFEPVPYLRLSYDFIDFADKHVGTYYVGYKHPNLTSSLFKENHGFMWHTDHPLPARETMIKSSKNAISFIISNKLQAPGHIYRQKLATFILTNDLSIDIWGNGTERYSKKFPNKKNIKGPFKDKEPYDPYSLSICIENHRHPHYFSEKISNCLVCNTTPIYLGCTQIETYFPNQVIHLTSNFQEDCALLTEISKNPSKYVREIKLKENDDVLNLMKNLPWKLNE